MWLCDCDGTFINKVGQYQLLSAISEQEWRLSEHQDLVTYLYRGLDNRNFTVNSDRLCVKMDLVIRTEFPYIKAGFIIQIRLTKHACINSLS
jgi:hypothetical protein